MKRLRFVITIDAPAQQVWDRMLDPEDFRKWTAAFHPDSHYLGSWAPGGSIRFLAADPDGKLSGMFSTITESRPPEYLAIKHLGEIVAGEEKADTEWAGATETYRLTETDGRTELVIEADTAGSQLAEFEQAYPKALAQLKQLVESN